jgi:hypothetical protein
MADARRGERKRSLVQLISDIPTLVTDLVKGEIELLKAEIIGKLKGLGIGAGLIAVALTFLFIMFIMLIMSATFALALVMPGWAAALVMAGILLLIALVIGLIGYRILKAQLPPVPTTTIASLQSDLNAIKGIGK